MLQPLPSSHQFGRRSGISTGHMLTQPHVQGVGWCWSCVEHEVGITDVETAEEGFGDRLQVHVFDAPYLQTGLLPSRLKFLVGHHGLEETQWISTKDWTTGRMPITVMKHTGLFYTKIFSLILNFTATFAKQRETSIFQSGYEI